jgi:hypothetical protein
MHCHLRVVDPSSAMESARALLLNSESPKCRIIFFNAVILLDMGHTLRRRHIQEE